MKKYLELVEEEFSDQHYERALPENFPYVGYSIEEDTALFTGDTRTELVDLGLSVKWARTNIGSTSTSDPGKLFTFANTEGYTIDQVDSGDTPEYSDTPGCEFVMGVMTKQTIPLNSPYDIAYAATGGTQRMPTQNEIIELITNCFITEKILDSEGNVWTKEMKVTTFTEGMLLLYAIKRTEEYPASFWNSISIVKHEYIFTSKINNKKIKFLNQDGWGQYWSSTIDPVNGYIPVFWFGNEQGLIDNGSPEWFCHVRGVENIAPKPVKNYFYLQSLANSNIIYNPSQNSSGGYASAAGFGSYLDYNTAVVEVAINSIQDDAWFVFDPYETYTLNEGDRMYFRCIQGKMFNFAEYYAAQLFCPSQPYAVGGDISTLVFGQENVQIISEPYAMGGFFKQSPLVDASELILPAIYLSRNCYVQMFFGCTLLEKAPQELPATTVTDINNDYYCYNSMFGGCTALTKSPIIYFEDLSLNGACGGMFYNCPNISTITCLAEGNQSAYGLFDGVSSTTGTFYKHPNATYEEGSIPEGWEVVNISNAPTKELVEYFYVKSREDGNVVFDPNNTGTFIERCRDAIQYSYDGTVWEDLSKQSNLISIDKNQIIYFRNHYAMPVSISSTKIVNPSKTFDVGGDPLTVLCNWKSYILYDNVHPNYYTWDNLFAYTKVVDASNLIITTNPKYQICNSMFADCQYLRIPPQFGNRQVAPNCNSMFRWCYSLEVAPELPMTELAPNCYYQMFDSCTTLVKAPALPAVVLQHQCYYSMFYGCTNLTEAPELWAPVLEQRCYEQMFQGCSSLRKVVCFAEVDNMQSNRISYQYWLGSCKNVELVISNNTKINFTSSLPSGSFITSVNPITVEQCSNLTITAKNVVGNASTTTIDYIAIVNGHGYNGNQLQDKLIRGLATSEDFGKNMSTTESVEKTITFDLAGVSASTTITQGKFIESFYSVDLNNSWDINTSSNIDSNLYDGMYYSYSNTGSGKTGYATMTINITNDLDTLTVYIKSDNSSSIVSRNYAGLSDVNCGSNTKSCTDTTYSSSFNIDGYEVLEYKDLKAGDFITVFYYKSSSSNYGNDRGCMLIQKPYSD